MNTKLLSIAIVIILAACNQQKGINLTNSSDIDLIQKSIEIDRSQIETIIGELPEMETAILVDKKGVKYPVQFDDIDGDGLWEVLFTQVDLKASETKFVHFNFDVEEEITVQTNIRFADINDASKEYKSFERLKSNTTELSQLYFQMEGPAWENDVVAFRNYFDARNGIDIFGKTTPEMALDGCGLKGGPSYHELQPWGMDVLKVGKSLGAGALAIETASGLHRVGTDCKGSFQLVKEGPLRSIFDLDFDGFELDGNLINVKHRISIEAGKAYYKSQVWVKGIDDAKLVTGIVNLNSDSVYSKSSEQFSYFYTHDNQAYDGEKLGMAIIVPSNILNVQTAPEEGEGITQTFYTTLNIMNQPIEFYFLAGWEKQNEVYASKTGFENEIQKQSEQLAKKLTIGMNKEDNVGL